MHTIKTKHGLLGCVHDTKPYVVGFNSARTAHRIARVIATPPTLRLERNRKLDVTEEVKRELMDLGLGGATFTSITIDVDSLLYVPKNTDPEMAFEGHVCEMDTADFYYLSFENNVGLVMPYETQSEDDEHWVLRANVVDPSGDIDKFRAGLMQGRPFK